MASWARWADTDASKGSKEKAKHDKEMSHEGNLRQALALGGHGVKAHIDSLGLHRGLQK